MPISLTNIVTNSADVDFNWGEESVHITFYPGKITERTMAQLKQLSQMTSDVDSVMAGYAALNHVLVQLIKSWDVYEDEAQSQMFPITEERLPDLPLFFRAQAAQAILGGIRPEAIAPEKTLS